MGSMKRSYGSGHLYVKSSAYYGRWRGPDGRFVNRRIGAVRVRGSKEGLTRPQAERELRRRIERETSRPAPSARERARTVDDMVDALRDRLEIEGARLSYRQNCASMQRVHISGIARGGVGYARGRRATGAAHASARPGAEEIRNVTTFLYSAFAFGMERGWCTVNPVTRATRRGDAATQVLTCASSRWSR